MATKTLVISPDNSDSTHLTHLLRGLGHQVFEAPPGLAPAQVLTAGLVENPALVFLNTDSTDYGKVTAWAREVQVHGLPLIMVRPSPLGQPLVHSWSLCHRVIKPLHEQQVRLAVQAALLDAAMDRRNRQIRTRPGHFDQAAVRQFRLLATVNGIMEAGLRCVESQWLAQDALGLACEYTDSTMGIILEGGPLGLRALASYSKARPGSGAEEAALLRWVAEPAWEGLWAGQPLGLPRESAEGGESGFLLGAPLIRDGHVQGAMLLGRGEPGYTIEEIEDTMVLAASFSRALVRKRLEEELAENNEQYLNITRQMPLGLYQVDIRTGLFISVNDVICEFTGYSREELLTMSAEDLLTEESLRYFLERAGRIQAGLPEPNQADLKIKIRGGDTLWINVISTFEYENGAPVRVSVIARDINDRKLAEEALRESEERYRHLFKYAPAGIYEIDFVNGRFASVNDLICEYMGYSREEMLDMPAIDILAEESRPAFFKRLEKILDGQPVEANPEFLIRGKNGQEFWVVLNAKFLYENNRLKGAFVIAHNITERRRAEEALRLSEEKYRTLLESIEEGYFEVDLKGRFVFFSDWFCEVTGYTREESLGLSVRDYLPPDTAEQLQKVFNTIYRTGLPATKLDYEVMLKNGDRRFHQLSASLSRDADGCPVGFRGAVRDVTAQKLAEKELKAALQEKDVLLKEIHHRVKNNMQVISSLLNLQEHQVTDATGRETLQEIRGRIMSMALIHEQLYRSTSLARIELQHYALDMAHFLLESYVAHRGHIKLLVDTDDVILDVDQAVPCGLILNEIITNSIKHALSGSSTGVITLKGRVTADQEAELIIGDNGPGLPPGLDWRHTRSMGLSLVVGLAEQQLGGRIELDNTQGATYTITFPLRNHDGGHQAPRHP